MTYRMPPYNGSINRLLPAKHTSTTQNSSLYPTSPSSRRLLQADQLAGQGTLSRQASWTNPPKPTASIWQGRSSPPKRPPSANPPSSIASQSAITIVDIKEEDIKVEIEKVESSRHLHQAPDSEKFFNVFHERYPDDSVSLDQLQGLFEACGLVLSEGEMETAVLRLPEDSRASGHITFSQCYELFTHLQSGWSDLESLEEEPGQAGRFQRWMASLSDQGATNVLLVLVVTMCCISSFLAAGLAIVFMIQESSQALNTNMQQDLSFVQGNLEVFTSNIFRTQQEERTEMFVVTLASAFESISYDNQMDAVGTKLQQTVTAVATTLSAWLGADPQAHFTGLGLLMALMAEQSLLSSGLDLTAATLNGVNADLPGGFEVLLGQWRGNGTNSVEYLTTFRFPNQCNRSCVVDDVTTAPMRAALSGATSAERGRDYRGADVYAGYSSVGGLGVEVSVDRSRMEAVRVAQIRAALEGLNAAATDSSEFLLGYIPTPGAAILPLMTLRGCDAACVQRAVAPRGPLARAIAGESGVVEAPNARGLPSVAAFAPVLVGPLRIGLVLWMTKEELSGTALASIAALVDAMNRAHPVPTEEFELTRFRTANGTAAFDHLTAYKYAAECPTGKCVLADFIKQAAKNCSQGVLRTTDYRGERVLAGTVCIPSLGAVLSFKTDVDELDRQALNIITLAVDDRNDRDTDTSAEYLLAAPKPGLTAREVSGYDDFQLMSRIKYPDSCINPNCTWNRKSALLALQDKEEVVACHDYRDMPVVAAPARSYAVEQGIGLALELDGSEFMQPIVDTAIEVACFSVGMVFGSTAVLVLMTKLLLRSMIAAKEEGKRAVEAEKDRFSKLVASMYPAYVLPRLLEGEKQMVCEVPGAAVFFSDIHEFTPVSNTLGSQKLLQLMGYVYGVMDMIADWYGVYKVKVIGDAYLAVTGLPGSDAENPGLDLLRFASCVCQVFGTRFVHPSEGSVLSILNSRARGSTVSSASSHQTGSTHHSAHALGRSPHGPPPPALSHNPKGPPSSRAPHNPLSPGAGQAQNDSLLAGNALATARHSRLTDTSRGADTGTTPLPGAVPAVKPPLPACSSEGSFGETDCSHVGDTQVQCVMSYGLAAGRLVAGVLAGRCPMFDVWGGTVNLASRMQSTGAPGRIQVSEHLYKKVITVPDQPFTFEAPRTTNCKGFGNVSAYMVRGTTEDIPQELQARLRLEPYFGPFRFDYVLATRGQLLGKEARAGSEPSSPCSPGSPLQLCDA